MNSFPKQEWLSFFGLLLIGASRMANLAVFNRDLRKLYTRVKLTDLGLEGEKPVHYIDLLRLDF